MQMPEARSSQTDSDAISLGDEPPRGEPCDDANNGDGDDSDYIEERPEDSDVAMAPPEVGVVSPPRESLGVDSPIVSGPTRTRPTAPFGGGSARGVPAGDDVPAVVRQRDAHSVSNVGQARSVRVGGDEVTRVPPAHIRDCSGRPTYRAGRDRSQADRLVPSVNVGPTALHALPDGERGAVKRTRTRTMSHCVARDGGFALPIDSRNWQLHLDVESTGLPPVEATWLARDSLLKRYSHNVLSTLPSPPVRTRVNYTALQVLTRGTPLHNRVQELAAHYRAQHGRVGVDAGIYSPMPMALQPKYVITPGEQLQARALSAFIHGANPDRAVHCGVCPVFNRVVCDRVMDIEVPGSGFVHHPISLLHKSKKMRVVTTAHADLANDYFHNRLKKGEVTVVKFSCLDEPDNCPFGLHVCVDCLFEADGDTPLHEICNHGRATCPVRMRLREFNLVRPPTYAPVFDSTAAAVNIPRVIAECGLRSFTHGGRERPPVFLRPPSWPSYYPAKDVGRQLTVRPRTTLVPQASLALRGLPRIRTSVQPTELPPPPPRTAAWPLLPDNRAPLLPAAPLAPVAAASLAKPPPGASVPAPCSTPFVPQFAEVDLKTMLVRSTEVFKTLEAFFMEHGVPHGMRDVASDVIKLLEDLEAMAVAQRRRHMFRNCP